jgi:hypothetical protein
LSLIEAGEHAKHGFITRQLAADIELDVGAAEYRHWAVLLRPDQTGSLASQLCLILSKKDWRLSPDMPTRAALLSQLEALDKDADFAKWADHALKQAFIQGKPTLNAPSKGNLDGAVGHLPTIRSLLFQR